MGWAEILLFTDNDLVFHIIITTAETAQGYDKLLWLKSNAVMSPKLNFLCQPSGSSLKSR